MADAELRAALTAAFVAKLESEGRIHRCGDCAKWMKPTCPRERHNNLTGRSIGPASLDIACQNWAAGVQGGGNG